jgi:hypothetical protein
MNSTTCTCYVRQLPAYDQYALHYGAHEHDCPRYRMSRDPVDAQHDIAHRAAGHAEILRAGAEQRPIRSILS